MTRGEGSQTKVHYKGKRDDYLVFVDDIETYKKWLTNKTIPLAHFVSPFTVFLTHKQGAQGMHDAAARSTLESEFGTGDAAEVMQNILIEGTVQTVEMPGRQGTSNDSMSHMKDH
ncbi:ribosome maturation protein [Stachybotrys elegans]|uniref:Ribosome maturation protein n=1 Tax=Stachybotrys elegans TaxID=80388 RepID=A0A8K0SHI8_9HYPO|nr:ribosome maturation protein [Stachybotrys elegans]